MRKLLQKAGFTLLELLLVIILIGILAAMIIPKFVGRTESAKRAAAEADVNVNLAIALDLYEMDNGTYPSTEQGLRALQEKPLTPPNPPNWQGPYIKESHSLQDPWKTEYVYVFPGDQNRASYDLCSSGPDRLSGTVDDIVNWAKPE